MIVYISSCISNHFVWYDILENEKYYFTDSQTDRSNTTIFFWHDNDDDDDEDNEAKEYI